MRNEEPQYHPTLISHTTKQSTSLHYVYAFSRYLFMHPLCLCVFLFIYTPSTLYPHMFLFSHPSILMSPLYSAVPKRLITSCSIYPSTHNTITSSMHIHPCSRARVAIYHVLISALNVVLYITFISVSRIKRPTISADIESFCQ